MSDKDGDGKCGVAPTRERPGTTRIGVTHRVLLTDPPYEDEHGTGQAAGGSAQPDESRRVRFYIMLNRYPDGRPCEVFVKASHGYQGWCDAVARLVSLLLQHGVGVEVICRQLAHGHFAPFGMVPRFGFARSFPDYLARWMLGECGTRSAESHATEDGTADGGRQVRNHRSTGASPVVASA